MATEQLIALRAAQWQAGERHVEAIFDRAEGLAADRVVEALVQEVRRRLGGTFTALELVQLYEAGTAWALPVAIDVAPGHATTWEARVVDAAFARYLREARDWAGGRLVLDES